MQVPLTVIFFFKEGSVILMTTVLNVSPDFTHYLKFLEFDLMIDSQVRQQLNPCCCCC